VRSGFAVIIKALASKMAPDSSYTNPNWEGMLRLELTAPGASQGAVSMKESQRDDTDSQIPLLRTIPLPNRRSLPRDLNVGIQKAGFSFAEERASVRMGDSVL
jgi:hypothetical protein